MWNKFIRFFNNQDYKDLKEEWEEQNILIEVQQAKIKQRDKKIKELNDKLEFSFKEKEECIMSSQQIIKELQEKLETKECQRRKLASSIGGLKAKINKLEEANNFLKTNRRSPSLEELKDYQLRRKRANKK